LKQRNNAGYDFLKKVTTETGLPNCIITEEMRQARITTRWFSEKEYDSCLSSLAEFLS